MKFVENITSPPFGPRQHAGSRPWLNSSIASGLSLYKALDHYSHDVGVHLLR